MQTCGLWQICTNISKEIILESLELATIQAKLKVECACDILF